MSTGELPKQTVASRIQLLWNAAVRHRASIAWLASAAVVMIAAFACTTIPIHDSVFDAAQLRILVAALSSVAASNLLLAVNRRDKRRHLAAWVTVTAGWYLILALT